MIEHIEHDGELLAIIVSGQFREPGTHFFTPPGLSQQLGYMRLASGTRIEAHVHNPVPRQVVFTQEVLVIRSGRLRVDFYSNARAYLHSRELVAGDVILLIQGGHGFEVLEALEMIEVKQGPYQGEEDKTRFEGVLPEQLRRPPDS